MNSAFSSAPFPAVISLPNVTRPSGSSLIFHSISVLRPVKAGRHSDREISPVGGEPSAQEVGQGAEVGQVAEPVIRLVLIPEVYCPGQVIGRQPGPVETLHWCRGIYRDRRLMFRVLRNTHGTSERSDRRRHRVHLQVLAGDYRFELGACRGKRTNSCPTSVIEPKVTR